MHFLTLQSTNNEISAWHNNDKRNNVHCTSTYIRKEAENPTYTETTQQIPKKLTIKKMSCSSSLTATTTTQTQLLKAKQVWECSHSYLSLLFTQSLSILN